MTNVEAAQRIVARAREVGVDEFCVCAGSRNSPLLYVLGSSDVRLFSFVDERAAAFFALGRIKQHGRPCAVVTTSGTAAAELLPAAIEAHYSGLPLLLITADRPARYHGTGAPQAIEQIGLFGVYADTSFEEWDGARPLHLNIEFDEPLIDAPCHSERSEESRGGTTVFRAASGSLAELGMTHDKAFEEWDGARPVHLNIELDEPLIDAPCHSERSEESRGGTTVSQAASGSLAELGMTHHKALEEWDGARPLHLNIEFDEPLIDAPCHSERSEESRGGTTVSQAASGSLAELGMTHDKAFEEWDGARPVHLNIELDEPLIDAPCHSERSEESRGETTVSQAASGSLAELGMTHHKVLILIGGLAPPDRPPVREWVLRTNAAVYAEPLSGLREDPALAPQRITNERMLARGGFDRVIRIGNVPTLRFWRDLDEKLRALPLVSYSRLPFAGLSRGEVFSLDELPEVRGGVDLGEDGAKAAAFAGILDGEPHSELAMFRALSRELPENARVYLGNSLPIREWDLAATREPRGFEYEANRGANGIDGQLSTFFGWCKPGAENVCVVGDLTALYDLNAPWIVPQLEASFRIVIINNGGGRIFSRVASLKPMNAAVRERIIENAHGLRFEHWAAMWGIEDRVTELRPDPEASRRVWERYDALW